MRPVREATAGLVAEESLLEDLLTGPDSGGQTDQPTAPGQTSSPALAGAGLAAVDDPGVPEDQVASLGLHYNSPGSVFLIRNVEKVSAEVLLRVLPSDLLLDLLSVRSGHQDKSPGVLGHVQEGNHSLHAVKAAFFKWILVDVEIQARS